MPVELWTTVPWLDPDEAQDEIDALHRALLVAGADAISTTTAGAARGLCDEFSTPTHRRKLLGAIRHHSHFLSIHGGGEERFREIEAGYRAQAAVLCSASLHRENVRAAIDSIATETPVLITAEIESMGSMLDGTLPEAFLDFARAVPGVAGCH
jgi:methionine synthase I (cobalamin-dependent)